MQIGRPAGRAQDGDGGAGRGVVGNHLQRPGDRAERTTSQHGAGGPTAAGSSAIAAAHRVDEVLVARHPLAAGAVRRHAGLPGRTLALVAAVAGDAAVAAAHVGRVGVAALAVDSADFADAAAAVGRPRDGLADPLAIAGIALALGVAGAGAAQVRHLGPADQPLFQPGAVGAGGPPAVPGPAPAVDAQEAPVPGIAVALGVAFAAAAGVRLADPAQLSTGALGGVVPAVSNHAATAQADGPAAIHRGLGLAALVGGAGAALARGAKLASQTLARVLAARIGWHLRRW